MSDQSGFHESRITNPESRTFALVAGEASGDLLGAGLIVALKERFPQARFVGIGGPKMIAAGLEAWYPAERLAVMGIVEVLPRLFELLRLRADVRRRLIELQPDAFVGIDAPDFNLGLEKKLKAAGIRTVHYVSPSVWAWREERAQKLGRSADLVLCLFPMEPPIYARYGIAARFVGHPLADRFPRASARAPARAMLGLSDDAPVLAVLPGSRLGEIARLGETFLDAAARVAAEIPNLQIVIPAANPECKAALQRLLSDSRFPLDSPHPAAGPAGSPRDSLPTSSQPDSRLLDGHAHEAMLAADVVLLASGTAALEALLAKRPMVVAYKVSPWTYRLVRWLKLMRTTRYSLPNILAGRDLVPELMQDACTPDALAQTLLALFRAPQQRAALVQEFERIHESLRGEGDASHAAAAAVAELLPSSPPSPANAVH